uniref:Glycosyl hydrolase family 38 C-terminal domain-containing protein n=1 Tax=Amphimedon queenslandica TaxID=400682 RepID=A0A1X7T4H6_AMPQE
MDQQFYWYNASTGNNIDTQNSNAYIFRPNSSMTFPVDSGDDYAEITSCYSKAINTGIFCQYHTEDEEKNVQFTILNDRSQGGGSITDGSVELMVHMHLVVGDGAVGPLNETGMSGDGLIIRGKHLLLLDNVDNSAHTQRMMAEELLMIPELSYFGLSASLPDNVHVLTLEYLDQSTILRLDHHFESNDPGKWSTTIDVKLRVGCSFLHVQYARAWVPKGLGYGAQLLFQELELVLFLQPISRTSTRTKLYQTLVPELDLFIAFTIKDVTELALGGNVALSDIKKLQWQTSTDETVPGPFNPPPVTGPNFIVSLSPMMIRTFNITIEPKIN